MKKLTYKFIYNYFKNNDCELLETEYINTNTKMQYKCSCGNISEITFGNFQQGKRCRKCSGSEKYKYEYIYNYFKSYKCELLESKYINAHVKMKYVCNCGNISHINFNKFQQGERCRKCSGSEKLSYEYVYNYFKENNCELIETEYINSKTNMKYKCSCDNITRISFNMFRQGQRCKKCGIKKRSISNSGENHHKWNPDREYIKVRHTVHSLCKRLLQNTLKRTSQPKTSKSEIMLGYNRKELLEHLQKDPLYKHWKDDTYNYHIDHIFPVSAFIEYNILDSNIICSLDNLQILSAPENLSKSDSYNKDEFINYLKNKNIILEEEFSLC